MLGWSKRAKVHPFLFCCLQPSACPMRSQKHPPQSLTALPLSSIQCDTSGLLCRSPGWSGGADHPPQCSESQGICEKQLEILGGQKSIGRSSLQSKSQRDTFAGTRRQKLNSPWRWRVPWAQGSCEFLAVPQERGVTWGESFGAASPAVKQDNTSVLTSVCLLCLDFKLLRAVSDTCMYSS